MTDAQPRVAVDDKIGIGRTHDDGGDTGRSVGVFRRSATRNAKVACGEVLDDERQWLVQTRDAPRDRDAVRTCSAAVLRRPTNQIAQRRGVLKQVVRSEREVGPATAALSDRCPAVLSACRREIVERDELEVAPVLETDERVVREPAGVLTARRYGEPALAVVRNGVG